MKRSNAAELRAAERRALIRDLRRARRSGLSAGHVYRQLLRNVQHWAVVLRLAPASVAGRVKLARAAVLEVYGERAKVELDQLDLIAPADAGERGQP